MLCRAVCSAVAPEVGDNWVVDASGPGLPLNKITGAFRPAGLEWIRGATLQVCSFGAGGPRRALQDKSRSRMEEEKGPARGKDDRVNKPFHKVGYGHFLV